MMNIDNKIRNKNPKFGESYLTIIATHKVEYTNKEVHTIGYDTMDIAGLKK